MRKFILIILIAFSQTATEAYANSDGTFCLSIKPELTKKVRITQFKISITSGRIKFVNDIPPGWYVSITNDPSWISTIQANILVGAAAINPDKFNDLVCIETIKLSGLEFKLEGEVASTHDFEKEVITKIAHSDFIMKRQ